MYVKENYYYYLLITGMEEEIILAIDPGTVKTGFAIFKKNSFKLSLIDFGQIRPPAKRALYDRLFIIHTAILELVQTYKPHALAIESQFVKKNVAVALKLGMARGMAIAAVGPKCKIFEYAPKKVKIAAIGAGSASKEQIRQMMKNYFNLKDLPEEDAADALAIGLCHCNQPQNLSERYV